MLNRLIAQFGPKSNLSLTVTDAPELIQTESLASIIGGVYGSAATPTEGLMAIERPSRINISDPFSAIFPIY